MAKAQDLARRIKGQLDRSVANLSAGDLPLHTIAAIDHGHAGSVSFEQGYAGIEQGTLLQDLKAILPDEFDFSLFPPGSDKEREIIEVLQEVAGGLQGRERRKTGSRNPVWPSSSRSCLRRSSRASGRSPEARHVLRLLMLWRRTAAEHGLEDCKGGRQLVTQRGDVRSG